MNIPGASIRLFRVFGIDIEINVTWLVILFLLTSSLSSVYFPSQFPGAPWYVYFSVGLATALLFFSSVLLHELSHSLVAIRNGLPISKITLFIFGGVSQMTEEPSDPKIELKMAAAGPLCSLVLSIVFAMLHQSAVNLGLPLYVSAPLEYLSLINLVLAVFNLIPGFPLDGGRIMRSILWLVTKDLSRATAIASRGGQLVAFTIIGGGVFLLLGGNTATGIWMILIGWFLEQAALASGQSGRTHNLLAHNVVKDVMTADVITVPANLTLEKAVHEHFLRYRHHSFPVDTDEGVIAMVALEDLKKVPRSEWMATLVEEVARPLDENDYVGQEQPVFNAVNIMTRHNRDHLLVTAEGEMVGIITRNDIVNLLRFKEQLEG